MLSIGYNTNTQRFEVFHLHPSRRTNVCYNATQPHTWLFMQTQAFSPNVDHPAVTYWFHFTLTRGAGVDSVLHSMSVITSPQEQPSFVSEGELRSQRRATCVGLGHQASAGKREVNLHRPEVRHRTFSLPKKTILISSVSRCRTGHRDSAPQQLRSWFRAHISVEFCSQWQ